MLYLTSSKSQGERSYKYLVNIFEKFQNFSVSEYTKIWWMETSSRWVGRGTVNSQTLWEKSHKLGSLQFDDDLSNRFIFDFI